MRIKAYHLCFHSLALTAVMITGVAADIIEIPADYPTIQAGIAESGNGDTILVYPGTYAEHINFLGKDIVTASLFLTTGDTSYIGLTAIVGDSERVSVVCFTGGETSDARLAGFTINNYPSGLDGGVYCENSNPTIAGNRLISNRSMRSGAAIECLNASPTIIDNLISGNRAGYLTELGNGGGISCNDGSNPVIENNVIDGNRGFGGGGIACSNRSHPRISNNSITNNSADIGGGIYIYSGSNPQIEQNIINDNSVDWWGGGIYSNQSSPFLERNIIAYNMSAKEAGGLLMHASNSNLYNNTISENIAADSAGGIWISHSNLIFVNDIIWNNDAYRYDELFISGSLPEITYSDISGGWDGEGNIASDPLFVDPVNSDFNLLHGSPCIDAGDPDFQYDPDGTRCDIGACFYEHTMIIDDDRVLPMNKSLIWNYPNPFNLSTVIAYSLPGSSRVKIGIYDVGGRLVDFFDNGIKPSGVYRFKWRASGLSSGVYFVRLITDNNYSTAGMILIK